jgi:hypothetical protein
MRHRLAALGFALIFLAVAATTASAAKPPPKGLGASMAIGSTGTSSCSGTLTVTWNFSKGVTSLSWGADPSDTGALSFSPGGIQFATPSKSGSFPVSFTLTAGTGQADVSASGPGFIAQTTSNTVTCTPTGQPDLTITNISFTFPAGDPPNSYTVTVQNIGNATANVANAVVQGYYTNSTDTTVFPPTDGGPACGTIMQPFASTLAPGASVDVVVGCAAAPTGQTDLMVGVDVNNVVAESNENNNVAVTALP